MARFGENAKWFKFASYRFDHTSELPPDANAGNATLDDVFEDARIVLLRTPPA